jgi:hypothetical protein
LVHLSTWDLFGAIAYTLASALFETVLVFLILTALSMILPGQFFRAKFVAQASMMVFLGAGWAVLAHLTSAALWSDNRLFLAWFLLLVAAWATSYLLVHRNPRLEEAIASLADRLMPASYFYICLDIPSVVIVVLRNTVGGVT